MSKVTFRVLSHPEPIAAVRCASSVEVMSSKNTVGEVSCHSNLGYGSFSGWKTRWAMS
jgi:hypothetical protein